MPQTTHVVPLGHRYSNQVYHSIKIDAHQLTDDCYIYGTSSIWVSVFTDHQKYFKALDQSYTPKLLSQKYNFPIKTLMLWQQNILRLKQLKNRKNRPRFIIDADKSQRILPHIETMEEKIVLEYFF